MTQYVGISKVRLPSYTRRFSIGMSAEKDSGVKHTHIGSGGVAHSFQKGPTDTIGISTVTFAGINAGCEIRVYLPNGTEIAGIESCDADHILTWAYYLPGNENNNVTVRIVSNAYKLKEFPYTTQLGNVSLPVQQELDRWYSNPV